MWGITVYGKIVLSLDFWIHESRMKEVGYPYEIVERRGKVNHVKLK